MHVHRSPQQSSCNSTREEALVVTTTSSQQQNRRACRACASLVGQTSTPHVACAPPTAHTAHRAYSDIAIVKIKLDSKATASKICVPSHNRWMIRCTNLDLAGCRLTLSIARGILGSLVMLFEAQHGKYGWGGGVRMVHGHLCVCSTYVSEHSRLRVQFHARHAPPFVQQ